MARRRLHPRPNDRTLTIDGETESIESWAARLGVGAGMIRRRLALGWSERDAVMTPPAWRRRRNG